MNNHTSLIGGNYFKYTPENDPNTLYVDLTGIDGIDHNGSAGDPFRTIPYAVTRAQPYNRIFVRAGIHVLDQQIDLSLEGLSLEGEGIGKTIITSNVFADVNAYMVYIFRADPLEGYNGYNKIEHITFDGAAEQVYNCIHIRRVGHVKIRYCEFIDIGRRAVNNWGARSAGGPLNILGDGFEVAYCRFYNAAGASNPADPWSSHGAITLGALRNCEIHHNHIESIPKAWLRGELIKSYDPGHLENLHIHHNTLLRNCSAADLVFAVELFDNYGNFHFHDNRVIGTLDLPRCHQTGPFSGSGAYQYGALIHDNQWIQPEYTDHDHPAISLEDGACNVEIFRNFVYHLPSGIHIAAGGAAYQYNDINIYYNIFMELGTSTGIVWQRGIHFSTDAHAHFFQNIKICNNIFTATGAGTDMGINMMDEGDARNFYVKNNIFVNYTTAYINADGTAGPTMDELELNNNCIFNCGGGNVPRFVGGYAPTNYTNLNDLVGVDPLFISADNYHLQALSPCIVAGEWVKLYEDYEKNPTNGIPNIGVYER